MLDVHEARGSSPLPPTILSLSAFLSAIILEVTHMQRARELIKPYLARDGVIGIYVLGSSTRPFRDELSDYDIEVIVTDDAYKATPDEEKHVFEIDDGPPRRVDHEFYLRPWSEFAQLASSTQDLFHYPYQHAIVLHDPTGEMTEVIRKLAELPEDVRRMRMRVHFLELLFSLGRARKTSERSGGLNVQLLYGEALVALTKLLFLVMGSWPATRHWSRDELILLGIDAEFIDRISDAFSSPTNDKMTSLVTEVRSFLVERGELLHDVGSEAFQDAYKELVHWAFLTAEGKKAFSDWGAR